MKILVINYKFSDYKGGDHRIQNLAKGLKEVGIDVLYASVYGYSQDLGKIVYQNRNYLVQRYFDTIQKSKVLASISNITWHPLLLLKTLLLIMNTFKTDENTIGMISVPPLSKLLPLTILKKTRVLVIDFGDIWSTYTYIFHEIIGDTKHSPIFKILARMYTSMEESLGLKAITRIYKQYDKVLITVPTRIMSLFLKKLGLKNVYFLHHPVDVSTDPSEVLGKNKAFHDTLNVLIFSSSNLSSEDEIQAINEIIDLSSKLNVKVRLFTIGYDVGKLNTNNNVHIKTFPLLRRKEYLKILRKYIHLAIILEPKNIQDASLIPRHISKAAEMISLGIPLITNCSALRDYVVDGVTGYLTPLNKVSEIWQAVLRDANFLRKLQLNALMWARENLHCKVVAARLLNLIRHSSENL